jgi:hypothetical protein
MVRELLDCGAAAPLWIGGPHNSSFILYSSMESTESMEGWRSGLVFAML